MPRLEVLVEEPSAQKALKHMLPKIVAQRAEFRVINMRNKARLLKELPKRLEGYRTRIENGEDLRILVLVDQDTDDCHELKRRLEQMARDAGMATKSNPESTGRFRVVNRIVVVELESWFMGDTDALRRAFPSLGHGFPRQFRTPDNGGTWKRLHRFLRENGIYKGHYPKISAADKIARHLDPESNRSPSFKHFRLAVEALL